MFLKLTIKIMKHICAFIVMRSITNGYFILPWFKLHNFYLISYYHLLSGTIQMVKTKYYKKINNFNYTKRSKLLRPLFFSFTLFVLLPKELLRECTKPVLNETFKLLGYINLVFFLMIHRKLSQRLFFWIKINILLFLL